MLPTGADQAVGHAGLEGTSHHGLPVLDDEARRAYQRRLADVDEDIEDAMRRHDAARADLARRDRDNLIAELRHAVGLGGRLRAVGSDSERARMAVARALRYGIGRLGENNPALAVHLENCVHIGTYCSYRPDPLSGVTWTL